MYKNQLFNPIPSYKGNPPCPSHNLIKWAKRNMVPEGSGWMKGVISRYLAWALLDNPRRMSNASPGLVLRALKTKTISEVEIVNDFQDLFLQFDVHFARALKFIGKERLNQLKYFDSAGKPKTVSSVIEEIRRITQSSVEAVEFETDEQAEKIIECVKGFAWWRIERGFSIHDARYLNHCGNIKYDKGKLEPRNTGDVIYSLRKEVNSERKAMSLPKLTFVVDNNGYLGESKGYANSLPSEKFHIYVVELISLPIIKGIKGGGREPGSNFRFSDLTEHKKRQVLSRNPLRFDPIGSKGVTAQLSSAAGRWVTISKPEFPHALDFWKEMEWLGDTLGLLCYQLPITVPNSFDVFWETKAFSPYLKGSGEFGNLRLLKPHWTKSQRNEAFDLIKQNKKKFFAKPSIFKKLHKFLKGLN